MDYLFDKMVQITEAKEENFWSGFWEQIEMMIQLFLSQIIEQVYGTDNLEKVQRILFLGANNFTSSDTTTIFSGTFWNIINTILGVTKSFGIPLIAMFFVIHILDVSTKEQLSVDSIIKVLIQLVLVVAIAGNIDVIVNALLSFGDSLLHAVQKKIGGTGSYNSPFDAVNIYENLSSSWNTTEHGIFPYWRVMGVFFSTALLRLSVQIMIIAADISALSRAIDVAWRIALAPVAVANSFEGGVNSGGIRYLKGLAGAILSGLLIYIIAAIGFGLSVSILSVEGADAFSAPMSTILIIASNLATAGAVIGVPQKIKEVFQ